MKWASWIYPFVDCSYSRGQAEERKFLLSSLMTIGSAMHMWLQLASCFCSLHMYLFMHWDNGRKEK